METWTAERVDALVSSDSDAARLWVALDGSRQVGCVRVHPVPRPGAHVIRELAVDADRLEPIVDRLLDIALDRLSNLNAALVRASTPPMRLYTGAYRRRGFVPVRRALTLAWDLSGQPWAAPSSATTVVHDARRYAPDLLAELYVEGMRPYWDWYIDERGGAEALKRRAAEHFTSLRGEDERWLVAELAASPVGLAGVSALAADEADLEGVYVLPAHRGEGVGSALMQVTLAMVRERTTRLVVTETTSFLESDIPSIRLYVRSGAQPQAEYVHLQAEGTSIWRHAPDSAEAPARPNSTSTEDGVTHMCSTGWQLRNRSGGESETAALRFVPPDGLPDTLVWLHRPGVRRLRGRARKGPLRPGGAGRSVRRGVPPRLRSVTV
jgi:GNAT superfamily N-acetyltransferase